MATTNDPCSSLVQAAESSGYQIVQTENLPARIPQYRPVPVALQPMVQSLLTSRYPTGMYSHQARAIDAGLRGEDVCLATSTASGKSLAFMALAADIVLRDRSARVLALYPAKALIQDQRKKWQDMLGPLGIGFNFIDGSVSSDLRPAILRSSAVVLMTPDVAHAWLLSHLEDRAVANFLQSLRLVILDEAHVYEGAFGTNMAYFLRRLQAVARPYQVVVSTATMGAPASFISELVGINPVCFGPEADGSGTPRKTIVLARDTTGKPFDSMVDLLLALTKTMKGHFLAFADSRRMVEQVVAATQRKEHADDDDEAEEDTAANRKSATHGLPKIVPFRAGYETEDRLEIQGALGRGQMVGVVSTSAMELGIDIGEIDVVVLLGLPPSAKAFWQRIGRAGRRNPGACLMIDDRGLVSNGANALTEFLSRPLEPSWLYLENRYIQYAHALCAACEKTSLREGLSPAFQTLPASFRAMLENEINPTEIVPSDLYPLKQKAQGGPHREFPIRTGIEQNFQVRTAQSISLGTVTFSQALREAYPGAIYHYMARPYRVFKFDYKSGEILAKHEKHWTTRPLSQTMVFPRFQGGTFWLVKSKTGFLAEVEMQVSERVIGFTEQRGPNKEEHKYEPGSPYFQRDITRFFATTGVCWYSADKSIDSEAMATLIQKAFCIKFGVQERDLGVGLFYTKQAPSDLGTCHGACVFDATNGSLRLTQRLAERFSEVLDLAIETAEHQSDAVTLGLLCSFARVNSEFRPAVAATAFSSSLARGAGPQDGDWITVIAPGETAMYISIDGPRRVIVKEHRYTPHGLMYQLKPAPHVDQWMVAANALEPIYGETKMLRANLITGETQELERASANVVGV